MYLVFPFIIVFAFKCIHDNQKTLLFRVAKFLLFSWEIKKVEGHWKDRLISWERDWKSDRNVKLCKDLFDLAWYISCVGREELVAVTKKVAVNYLLSYRHLMGTFFWILRSKSVLFRGDKRKWCLIKIKDKLLLSIWHWRSILARSIWPTWHWKFFFR